MKLNIRGLRSIVRSALLRETSNALEEFIHLARRVVSGDRDSFLVLQDMLEEDPDHSHLAKMIRGDTKERAAVLSHILGETNLNYARMFPTIPRPGGGNILFQKTFFQVVNPPYIVNVFPDAEYLVATVSTSKRFDVPDDVPSAEPVVAISLRSDDSVVVSDAYNAEEIVRPGENKYEMFRNVMDSVLVPAKKEIDDILSAIA